MDRYLYLAAFKRRRVEAPVAVFSLGKVGTTAVSQCLEGELGGSIVHCHVATRQAIDEELTKTAHIRGLNLDHLWRGEFFRRMLVREPHRSWKIICGVRDPVARVVSAIFQVGAARGDLPSRPKPGEELVDRITHLVEERFREPHYSGLNWFEEQLQEVTGIDVFATPFDHALGYQTYSRGRFDVLVLRFEDLARTGSDGLATFLGMSGLDLKTANASGEKPYSDAYRFIRESIKIPDAVLDLAYDSALSSHFYTVTERASFRAKWSRKVEAPPA